MYWLGDIDEIDDTFLCLPKVHGYLASDIWYITKWHGSDKTRLVESAILLLEELLHNEAGIFMDFILN